MGIIEEKHRKRKRSEDIKKAILATVKVAGLLTIASVAPNSVKYLKSLGIVPGKRQKEIMSVSKDRLIKNGLLKYENNFIELTKKGESELELLETKDWKIDKPKKWDGKWRMLIFDIPEKKKLIRNRVRLTLLHIGFVRLQDSVWVYPYPCEDFVNILKIDLNIGKDLLYLIVDSIENDRNLKKLFDLPLEK